MVTGFDAEYQYGPPDYNKGPLTVIKFTLFKSKMHFRLLEGLFFFPHVQFLQGLTFPKKLANSIGQLANLVCQLVCKWQVGGNLSKLANPHPWARVCKLFANVGKLRVCKPGLPKFANPVAIFAGFAKLRLYVTRYTQFLAIFGVLWHFFWQFLFLVGWPTLANVCQRWLANILDSLPTGSEKIVKEPVGKLVGKQGLLKNKLGNVDDNVTSNPGFYSKK